MDIRDFFIEASTQICNGHNDRVANRTDDEYWELAQINILQALSFSFMSFTLLIMYKYPVLQLHPQQIIFWLIIADTMYLFDFRQFYMVCQPNNFYLAILEFTWPWYKKNIFYIQKFTSDLFVFDLFLNEVLQIAIAIISAGFCIDLIRSIQNPFGSYEKRAKKITTYTLGTILVYFVYLLLIYKNLDFLYSSMTFETYLRAYALFLRPFVSLMQVIESVAGAYSLWVSFTGLYIRKGFNK
jgi:hypothetical protein